MRIIIFLLLIILGFFIVRFASSGQFSSDPICKTHHDRYAVIKKDIEGSQYSLLVADNVDKWSYGLMNVKSRGDICGADGMIFAFGSVQPRGFWNKNTLVDLKLYWMLGDEVLGTSDMLSVTKTGQVTTYESPAPASDVVEIIK